MFPSKHRRRERHTCTVIYLLKTLFQSAFYELHFMNMIREENLKMFSANNFSQFVLFIFCLKIVAIASRVLRRFTIFALIDRGTSS